MAANRGWMALLIVLVTGAAAMQEIPMDEPMEPCAEAFRWASSKAIQLHAGGMAMDIAGSDDVNAALAAVTDAVQDEAPRVPRVTALVAEARGVVERRVALVVARVDVHLQVVDEHLHLEPCTRPCRRQP